MYPPKGLRSYKCWKRLDGDEKFVYLLFAVETIREQRFFMSYKAIAQEMGKSDKLAKIAVAGLAEKGFIKVFHTYRCNGYITIPCWRAAGEHSFEEDDSLIRQAREEYARHPLFAPKEEMKRRRRRYNEIKVGSKLVRKGQDERATDNVDKQQIRESGDERE